MGPACIVVLGDIHVLHGPVLVCHVTQVIGPADPSARGCCSCCHVQPADNLKQWHSAVRHMLVAAAGSQARWCHSCCSMRHWADLALLERPLHRRLQRLAGSRLMGVVSLLAPLLSLGEKGLRDRGIVISLQRSCPCDKQGPAPLYVVCRA